MSVEYCESYFHSDVYICLKLRIVFLHYNPMYNSVMSMHITMKSLSTK